jgi:hypothetical protein
MLLEFRPGEELKGLLAETVVSTLEGRERFSPLALDLFRVEAGLEKGLRKEIEGGFEVFTETIEGEPDRVATGEAIDLCGQLF